MDTKDPMALVSKTAALMEQFERRCSDIEQQQRRLAQQLEQAAQSLVAPEKPPHPIHSKA